MNTNSLAIYGAGGHGKVVADAAELNNWKQIYFFDENYLAQPTNGSWPVIGDFTTLCQRFQDFDGVIVAIGNNKTRLEKHQLLQKLGAQIVNIIHPSAVISKHVSIGSGCVVVAGAVINPFSRLGDCVIINTCSSVGHDCQLNDAVHVCPGTRLAGQVSVGKASWLGIGSSIVQGVSIMENIYVGAGSVVVKDLKQSGTYYGIPAKLVEN
ncbi:acetyltransferase [Aeromonas caviae]|uniref:acetyltransferase n=1 Tax=Aeromonas caviae TaxID=648 RepID=UPI002378C471|nr:acetyltransferase [Aeromonas caviae]